MKNKVKLRLTILILLWPFTLLAAPPPYPKGVWGGFGAGNAVTPELAGNTGVVGVGVTEDWNVIESQAPDPDGTHHYYWDTLDSHIASAVAAGFPFVQISVVNSSDNTPAWLVNRIGVDVGGLCLLDPGAFHTTFCQPIKTCNYWDAVFHQARLALIAAAGARYNSNPHVIAFNAQFANHNSNDWNIQQTVGILNCPTCGATPTPTPSPGGCDQNTRCGNTGVDQVAQWLANGWTEEKMLQVGKDICDAVAAAFPDKWIKLPIGSTDIKLGAHAGATPAAADFTTLMRDLTAYVATRPYASRFIVQRNTVDTNWGNDTPATLASNPPGPNGERYFRKVVADAVPLSGMQMVQRATDSASNLYRLNLGVNPMLGSAAANDAFIMQKALNGSVPYLTPFVEVWPQDASNPAFYSMMAATTLAMGGALRSPTPTPTPAPYPTPVKPFPAGIVDLPGSITASNPIGPISAHPWQNVNVDGMRIRTSWADIETADGVYNWALIDDCLPLASASGKFIGLGVVAGIKSPPWLMGGDTFTDGSTATNAATLTSATANFVAGDVGRVIVSDKFPAGTTIVSRTSTVATLSAVAIATKTGVAFSILARHPGVEFRVLTAPDTGVMPVPWDPVALAKWKRFVAAFGARYDGNTKLLYVPMGGFSQTGESYLASQTVDADYFNAKAVAAGYVATSILSAGMVAWEAVTKDVIDTYMTAFPTTPPFITVAQPFPASYGGVTALKEIVAWALAKYPGRIGIMNSQLHATSAPGYYLNAMIYANRLTQPTGFQFLCSSAPGNLARLSNSTPFGSDPLLSAYDAMNASFSAAVNIGAKFVEVYEPDVNNTAYPTMLATEGAAFKSSVPPMAPTNLRIP